MSGPPEWRGKAARRSAAGQGPRRRIDDVTVSVEGRPRLGVAEVGRAVLDHYGLEGTLAPLPGEWDQNFRLDAGGGRRCVVKLANRGHEEGVLELQSSALDHLAASALTVRSPGIVRTGSGEPLARFRDAGGEAHRMRLLTWLEGTPLAGRLPLPAGGLRALGRALGELNLALADFSHPAMDRDLQWDLRRAAWISRWTHLVTGPDRRALVERTLLDYRGRVRPALDGLPMSVIHNDANEENILIAGESDGSVAIVGLLDFGDMLRTNRIHELAVACAYALSAKADPVAQALEAAEGYAGILPLEQEEIDLLPDLIRVRLAVSVVNSARAEREDPANLHRRSSEEAAWALLMAMGAPDGARGRPRAGKPEADRAGEVERLAARRRKILGPSLSLSYARPLTILRGRGVWLHDAGGRPYLDCVNNVCHVGHGHPRVVEAISRQAATLNTNTRYLHPAILDYAGRLAALFADPLGVCFFVNSGSEANELAIRMARAHTGRRDVITLDRAYHGNTQALVDVSPCKCEGPGGTGLPEWVRKAPSPDPYRGIHRGEGSGRGYAEEIARICREMVDDGRPPALLIAEAIQGCGGQIVPPEGFLREAFDLVRAAGGVAIADEVQIGLGRVGSHWWGFEAQGAIPDIVTLGKPIGNGHPLGAVVTTREIAASFANGMEYFSTFGGNPVAMAAGMAVLDVIEGEGLRVRAERVGAFLMAGLRDLATRCEAIGEVRGMGLFIGVEMVTDRALRSPDGVAAARLVEGAVADGILLSTDGPDQNVIKIKPPLVFSEDDARALLWSMERALTRQGPRGSPAAGAAVAERRQRGCQSSSKRPA
jgi:4-aminobutyrate aminotransferase-like enzyme